MRDSDTIARCAIVGLFVIACGAFSSRAEEVWSARQGTTTLVLYHDALDDLGVFVSAAAEGVSPSEPFSRLELAVIASSDLTFIVDQGSVVEMFGRRVHLVEGLEFLARSGEHIVTDLAISTDADPSPKRQRGVSVPSADLSGCTGGCLELHDFKVGFDRRTERLTIFSRQVTVSQSLADALGDPRLVGTVMGTAEMVVDAQWVGGDEPVPLPELQHAGGAEAGGGIGPDVTMCQVFGLQQFGRLGDVVGLASGGTSWNVGDEELDWLASPSPFHPFIVFNLYRLQTVDGSERFEQVGQSWIKHGFCALDNTQCGGPICQATGCRSLNVNCTDTYTPGLNASQFGLGPRFELNPWTGGWTRTGSHFTQPGGHTAISHRLQVHDADLDPAQNAGATYYTDQFYITYDDVDVMNNSGWKPVTQYCDLNGNGNLDEVCNVTGIPHDCEETCDLDCPECPPTVPGTWGFEMSGAGTRPNIGFAIDAWTGAQQTMLAQVVPPVEFVSPDGRCVLAAKVTDLGGGAWHYEYALFNIDMDRQVGSFSIPVSSGTALTNVGFYAVEHHDEEFNTVAADQVVIDNAPWSWELTFDAVTWSTTTNPLRWGTVYNFRFDANVPSVDTTVTLGLFRAGTPGEVTGTTVGPQAGPPDCNGNGHPDDCDVDCASPGCGEPCGGSEDCNGSGLPDECELADNDCNANEIPDECDVSGGTSDDCNGSGIPDECELPDDDCNSNGTLDECDISGGTSDDCNTNGIPDECELVENDCNTNGTPDDCDISDGTSVDCDHDGVPDECEVDPQCLADRCEQANPICPGSFSGNTVDADTDGSATCGSSTFSNSVWYSYIPGSDGPLTLTTCGAGNYDTVISMHTGCPGTIANQHACTDDGCSEPGFRTNLNTMVVEGVRYLIRVSGYNGARGSFVLTLIGPECSFPDCNANGIDDAIDIADGTSEDVNANGIPDECEQPCTDDADCDDGLFCNGAETCDPTDPDADPDGCVGGTPPSCDDEVGCTDDSCDPTANGGTGACANDPNDGDCDNDRFCDGVETCDAIDGCQPGTPPCGAGEVCNEDTNQCESDCNGNATRDLPSCYIAGEHLSVRMSYEPPAGTFAVGVEDTPPSGWSISNISDGGSWDPVNRKVKWVFFNGHPRTVSYIATPPTEKAGEVCFAGSINFDGGPNLCVGGDTCIDDLNCNHHPADAPDEPCAACPEATCGCSESTCQDWRIELCEIVGYVCRWGSGCQDDLATTVRGVFLFLTGEFYCWDDVPGDWFPEGECLSGQATYGGSASREAESVTTERAGAVRELPACYLGDEPVTVHVAYTSPDGAFAVGVEDRPPSGWSVSEISDGGFWDAANGKVKWVFFDGALRTVSYTATPPLGKAAVECFEGAINFEGGPNQQVDGVRCVGACGDSDGDGYVDLDDYHSFLTCVDEYVEGDPKACRVMDVNSDGAVNMIDWRAFQVLFTGSGP
ncbi:MAG: hypothetical protein V3W34_09445 [Phycisphaerae bacterium]